MVMKIKGIYKSFKFTISKIFVVKERDEMEIGYPTDVKHVAHVGWDNSSIATGPSWMNEFRTSPPNFATSSGNNTGDPRCTNNPMPLTACSNQDMNKPVRSKSTSIINSSSSDHHNHNSSKKNKSRKTKSTSYDPRSSSSSSSTYKTIKSTKVKAYVQ